jgi:hypothetical protein
MTVRSLLFGFLSGAITFYIFRVIQPVEPGGWRLLECIFMAIDGGLLLALISGVIQHTVLREVPSFKTASVLLIGWTGGLVAANFLPAFQLVRYDQTHAPYPADPLVQMFLYNATPFLCAAAGALAAGAVFYVGRIRKESN